MKPEKKLRDVFVVSLSIILIGVITIIASVFYSCSNSQESANTPQPPPKTSSPGLISPGAPKVVDVDEIAANPGEFENSRSVGVTGKVISVNATTSIFSLGCEDACLTMPVKYSEKLPSPGTRVTVYGKIRKDNEGKYIFEADRLEVK